MSTMTLAEALRVTAKRIQDNPDTYKWVRADDCNCGHLFLTISGQKKSQHSPRYIVGNWSWLADRPEARCPISDVPVGHLIGVLRNFGLSMPQLAHLEGLSDLEIRHRAKLPGSPHGVFTDKDKLESVIAYMEAWASILDEQVNDSLEDAGRSVAVAAV